jgi:hypothetical protein
MDDLETQLLYFESLQKSMRTEVKAANSCPPATSDIALNLKNRENAIKTAGYGPLNPAEPNESFWQEKAKRWSVTIDDAKKSVCGNCVMFIRTPSMLDCIRTGLEAGQSSSKNAWDAIDTAELGYCEAFDFKCAAKRTCSAWVVGGPITSEKQGRHGEKSADEIDINELPKYDEFYSVKSAFDQVEDEIDTKAAKARLKDPKGGLTAAGRKFFKRTEGANLKPGVRGPADTPEKMRRKGSFLTRFFTNPSGPMKDENGKATRLALSAAAWGEPVPQNMDDAAELAAKGRRMLERYGNLKKKDDFGNIEEKSKKKPPFWESEDNSSDESTPLTAKQKRMAMARAAKAGRKYPNLVDNVWASRQ